MIGLKKERFYRSVKRKKVVFERFFATNSVSGGASALGITGGVNGELHLRKTLCAKISNNCDFSRDVLKPCVGAELFYTTAGDTIKKLQADQIENIFRVRLKGADGSLFERYLFAWNNGYVRLYSEEKGTFVLGVPIGENVRGAYLRSVDGEEKFLLVGSKKALFFQSDEAFYPSEHSDWTSVLCVCKNRLFVVLQDGRLAYSDPSVPWDISESIDNGGYVELPLALGRPIEMTAVGEHVYIFFAYGIMRLTVKGGAREFSLEEIPYTGGKIVEGSICGFDDGAVFLTNDGALWRVRKKETQPVCKDFALWLKQDEAKCRAVVYDEKYFLHYINVNGEVCSLTLGLDGESCSPCYDLSALTSVGDAALFVRNGTLYRLGGEVLPSGEFCTFESVEMDFGLRGKKLLRRLELSGNGSITLRVYCDGRLIQRTVAFTYGRASVVLNVRGERFSFGVELGSRCYLRSISAEIER